MTGATGYIGGRLVPRLLEAGHRVRCLAREPRKLAGRPWAGDPRVEIVAGDTADIASLRQAMEGCGPAFYFVHSMVAAGREYAERDRAMAKAFARAAEDTGLERIVYLGGLGELGEGLSEHLASRREVEEILASGQTPVTVLRAAMIIGSGSASFEILRYLVERLPVMVTPRWVTTESQPIAVRNVVQYLVDCLAVAETAGRTLDIGGPDVLSYRELMRIMAEERGLRRRYVIPVPVLTPRLSSLWIHLVTPISHRIARPLAEGLRNRVVCRNDEAQRLMPQELLGVREAIRAALDRVAHDDVETSWSMAGPIPGDPDWAGGTVFTDRRSLLVDAPPEAVWRAVVRIGGRPRLVRRRRPVAAAGVDGPARGRPRPAARPARSRGGGLRRGARLLAGDRDRPEPPPGPAGRDEAPRRGAPRVHAGAGGERDPPDADGEVPSPGARRPRLLVRRPSAARGRLPRDAAGRAASRRRLRARLPGALRLA